MRPFILLGQCRNRGGDLHFQASCPRINRGYGAAFDFDWPSGLDVAGVDHTIPSLAGTSKRYTSAVLIGDADDLDKAVLLVPGWSPSRVAVEMPAAGAVQEVCGLQPCTPSFEPVQPSDHFNLDQSA